VQDRYHGRYQGAPSDGRAWEAGGMSARVVRGGSWSLNSGSARAAYRGSYGPVSRSGNLGLRLARTLSP
jgi:formylglycine-generating enzyme required for sulfatase activity